MIEGRSMPRSGIRDLVRLLRDDVRMRSFVDAELGPLLVHDASHPARLVPVLSAYLHCGGNKAGAAAASHLSRPAFYHRLQRIEEVLGVSLADTERRASLHVALLGLEELRSETAGTMETRSL